MPDSFDKIGIYSRDIDAPPLFRTESLTCYDMEGAEKYLQSIKTKSHIRSVYDAIQSGIDEVHKKVRDGQDTEELREWLARAELVRMRAREYAHRLGVLVP